MHLVLWLLLTQVPTWAAFHSACITGTWWHMWLNADWALLLQEKTWNSQWRVEWCQTEEEVFLSCPLPPKSPHHCGGPGLGSWITMGQTPPGWPSSIQAEDVETPAVKQKTHWNRDLQPSTCVWALKVDHLLTLSLTSEKQPAHSRAEWKCLKLLLALNSEQNPRIQKKKLHELDWFFLSDRANLFCLLVWTAASLSVAPWTDNGHAFPRQGESFLLSPFHPPDEVRVKAEAGNGCATREIIQLLDQRGHTRGLITSSQPAKRPRAGVPQLATLIYWNMGRVLRLMLCFVWKCPLNTSPCVIFLPE